MSVVSFVTPGQIPLDSFTLMGVNVKTSSTAIGRFGTGLKYALAVVLREGGVFRLWVDGVEHEFYTSRKKFRGQEFDQVRMRKRNGLGRWISSRALPFTTQLGRDWSLWQAYRELESNTRDEGGRTLVGGGMLSGTGTVIQVDCPGFAEAIEEEDVFIDTDRLERVYNGPIVEIYDAPAAHIYYQGIRVYTPRYPTLFTYNFRSPHVQLTEDRTAGNIWSMLYHLARAIQNDVESESVLDRILEKSDSASFENYELNFDESTGGEFFRQRVRWVADRGRLGRSAEIYYDRSDEPEVDVTSITLPDAVWEEILQALDDSDNESLARSIREEAGW